MLCTLFAVHTYVASTEKGAESRQQEGNTTQRCTHMYILRHTESETDVQTEDVGASIALELQQEIWYGAGEGSDAGGVGGKTTIKAQAEAHYKKAWERKTGVSKTHKLDLEIPANTRMNIVQNKGRAKYRQKTTTTATLDFGVEIQTRSFWYMKLPSLDDFIQAVGGYFPTKAEYGTETNNMIKYFKGKPINIDEIKDTLEKLGKAVIEKEVSFDRASTGDVKVKSSEI